jgi:L-iditol 2-dehydrogenase
VQDVPDPEGEVVVRVDAATTCGTDAKMFHRGHPVLPAYPCPFGHETAGTREDTGERVLVSDSVACGRCAPCRAGRPQICRAPRWVLGAFAERIAAPAAALHAIPDGLEPAGAAMAEPLAAAVHAVARGGEAGDAGVLGGGPMGLMLARLLVLAGRDVTVADRHPERRAQAEALGARAVEALERHELVFEAVGRPEAWRAAVEAAAPGATVVLVGGCAAGAQAPLPTARCTTTSSTCAGASITARPRWTRPSRDSPPARWTGAPSPVRRSGSTGSRARWRHPRRARRARSWSSPAGPDRRPRPHTRLLPTQALGPS